MKLKRIDLRSIILQEIEKMEEDSLLHTHDDRHRNANDTNSCYACGVTPDRSVSTSCKACGTMYENNLNEGGCGCGTCDGCAKKDSIFKIGDFSNLDNTNISPDEAYGVGYEASKINHKEHHDNDYMSKPSLYKVAKYAQKLLAMIPDDHEMDDWQRTKIAQIADDISEVYHSLDYDKHKGAL